ncbi:DUF4959 domain-containing protein [Puteibacter caeruleilacunae]|nr:DUF4959 domain-containing protein [Puteibacter caeruleilacunae]
MYSNFLNIQKSKNYKQMKDKILFILCFVFCLSGAFIACDDALGPDYLSKDGTKPAPLSNVEVTPIPGGAKISYTLPENNDLLGVKAYYTLPGGQDAVVRSSIYKNEVILTGLIKLESTKVRLVTFDHSGNESDPVSTEFVPLTAPVITAAQSTVVEPDFGGAKFSFENDSESALDMYIMVNLKTKDASADSIVLLDVRNFGLEKPKPFIIRGFDVKPYDFFIFYKDRWDNVSDTVKVNIEPIFEEKLPGDVMERYRLPHDMPEFGGTYPDDFPSHGLWSPERMYDGKIDLNGAEGWRGYDGPEAETYDPEPVEEYRSPFDPKRVTAHLYTIDLGGPRVLSRFTYHPLTSGYFAGGGWKIIDVWGTNETPNADGSFDGWTKLVEDFEFEVPKNHNARKREIIHNGLEVPMPSVPVRYLRFAFKKNYSTILAFNATEVSFYGQVLDK